MSLHLSGSWSVPNAKQLSFVDAGSALDFIHWLETTKATVVGAQKLKVIKPGTELSDLPIVTPTTQVYPSFMLFRKN